MEKNIYSFRNLCRESPELQLGDGSTKIILNASGTADDVSLELKAFLDYVAGKVVEVQNSMLVTC